MGEVVGFVVMPAEVRARVESLDAAILSLDNDVTANKSKLSKSWRAGWNGFVRRWQLERERWTSWESRLFASRVMPRLLRFELNLRKWAAQYERKTGERTNLIPAKDAEDLSLFPTFGVEVWALLAIGIVAFAWSKK